MSAIRGVEKQNALMDGESLFADADERRRAFVAYYALVSWMDDNVGRILGALDEAGLTDDTIVVYSSDHGDNVGARGLWGKSNMYEESVAVPLLMAHPDLAPGTCATPVSLVDLAATIPDCFWPGEARPAWLANHWSTSRVVMPIRSGRSSVNITQLAR